MPVPPGYPAVIPYFVVTEARALIEFVTAAFGGTETLRVDGHGGTIAHAEVRIGDSLIGLGEPTTPEPLTRAATLLDVDDVAATYRSALAAGAISIQPPTAQPYGDRRADVEDGGGNRWFIATRIAG